MAFNPDAYLAKKVVPVDTSNSAPASGFNPDTYLSAKEAQAPAEKPGLIEDALTNIVVPVGRFVDSYTGAPSRAAVGQLIDNKGLLSAGSAFVNQVGERPESAPTGKELAQKLGASEKSVSDIIPSLYTESGEGVALKKGGFFDPTASGTAGLGLDIATDWSNVIPGALALKGASKVAKGAANVGKGILKGGTTVAAKTADAITGTTATTRAIKSIGDVSTKTKDIIDGVLNPKQLPDFNKTVELAKKHGIDPSLLSSNLEFGPRSSITRLERTLREGPVGESMLENYSQGLNAISDAFNNTSQKLFRGPLKNEIQAGEILRGSFEKSQSKLLGSMDLTYKKVAKYAPGLYINKGELSSLNSTLNGVEKYAKGLMKRPIDKADIEQGRSLIMAVNGIKSTNGSYKQTADLLERLGKKAFSPQYIIGRVPPDIENLQKLYFKTSESLLNTVKKDVSPEFYTELANNNKVMSEFFGHRESIKQALQNSKSPEQLYKSVILSGDSKKIGSLKKILPPEDVQTLKGAFLNSIIKTTDDGSINFQQMSNALRSKKNQVAALFEPSEIQEIAELVKLGQDYGPSIMSTSGTGASNAFRDLGKGLLTGFRDEKALDLMKQRARTPKPSGLLSGTENSGLIDNVTHLPTVTFDSKAFKRGPKERRLKAAQSISPGLYAREDEESQ